VKNVDVIAPEELLIVCGDKLMLPRDVEPSKIATIPPGVEADPREETTTDNSMRSPCGAVLDEEDRTIPVGLGFTTSVNEVDEEPTVFELAKLALSSYVPAGRVSLKLAAPAPSVEDTSKGRGTPVAPTGTAVKLIR